MTQPEEQQSEQRTLFSWIGIIGVGAVLLGLWILLLDNWEIAPDWLKLLFGSGVLWASLTGAGRCSVLPEKWPRDLFLLLHSGALLLMVALISMVYDLQTNPWKAFALCAILSLPGALTSSLSVLGDVVIVYSLMALFTFIGGHESLHPLLQGYGIHFFFGVLALVLFSYSQRLSESPAMKSAVSRWGWILATFSLVGSIEGFGRWGLTPTRSDLWLMLAFVGACIFAKDRISSHHYRTNGRLFWLGASLLPLSIITQSIFGDWLRLVLGFVLSVWFLVLLVQHCLALRDPNGARWALALLVFRILFFYGELLNDSDASGVWLILLGASMGVFAYSWSRLQPMIEAASQSQAEVAAPAPQGDQSFVFLSLGVIESILFFLWILFLELR